MVERSSLLDVQKVEKDSLYNINGCFGVTIISKIKHFTRIQTTKEFNSIYNKNTSKIWHASGFVLFYRQGKAYKVGFVASKKIGNAVHRNRAKRLLRAHFIENIDLIAAGSYILVAKPDLLRNSFIETKKSYLQALKKCSALT